MLPKTFEPVGWSPEHTKLAGSSKAATGAMAAVIPTTQSPEEQYTFAVALDAFVPRHEHVVSLFNVYVPLS
jgi:hypothetical protein